MSLKFKTKAESGSLGLQPHGRHTTKWATLKHQHFNVARRNCDDDSATHAVSNPFREGLTVRHGVRLSRGRRLANQVEPRLVNVVVYSAESTCLRQCL